MLITIGFLLLFSLHTQAELYRCENQEGLIRFTDQPCPTSGHVYQPKAIMTDYKTISPPTSHSITKTRPNNKQDTCPFISNTQQRNLKVKNQFIKGLTQAHIQQRLGKAHKINNSKNNSVWVYNGEYVKRTFRFKNSCLTSWKEKWKKGHESQISKFRDER